MCLTEAWKVTIYRRNRLRSEHRVWLCVCFMYSTVCNVLVFMWLLPFVSLLEHFMIIICAVSAKTLLIANPERKKNAIRLHRHHHRRRRKRRRRLSFDTVVIHSFFRRAPSLSQPLCMCVYVWIEIWIENCYHKHIWLGRFLYARTQFAVNSTTKNIINHFGSFSTFFALTAFQCFGSFSAVTFLFFFIAELRLRLLLNFISVFFLPARKLVM